MHHEEGEPGTPVVVCLWRKPYQKPLRDTGETWDWLQWGPTYVRRLRAGVQRFSGLETVCLTDDPEIPEPTLPIVGPGRGWWAKLDLLNPAHRLDDVLYLDLDNVVCGDLSPLLNLAPKPLIMADDKIYPRLPNGSVLRINPSALGWLWDLYCQDAPSIHQAYTGWPHGADQGFMAAQVANYCGNPVPLFTDLLPPQTLLNARSELEAGVSLSPETCVVYGSWRPKPHESHHPFYRQYWVDAVGQPA